MTLILSNEEIDQVLTMPECIRALEQAYEARAALRAVNRPRTDIYTPHSRPDAFYVFKSFEGMLPDAGVVALRLNSDVIAWSEYAGVIRKDKQPLVQGRFNGLVLLFSTETGELLSIFPDGIMQRMRVGATNGIAARYLAAEDASVYGLLGSGFQAGSQLMAIAAVRNLSEVRVFSPNEAHRVAFAEEWSERLGLPIRPVESAREAAAGAHILGAATNAIRPLIEAEWLEAGVHVTCVKRSELGEAALARCDRVVVHTHEGAPINYLVGVGDVPVASHDPLELMELVRAGKPVSSEALERARAGTPKFPDQPELSDLVAAGEVARKEGETTAFVNNIGLGIQFAALGALAYRSATQRGLGRQVPTDWFTQDVHP